MSEIELQSIVDELRNADSPVEAERRLRRALAMEAEACAGLMVAGALDDIHDSILRRAERYRASEAPAQ